MSDFRSRLYTLSGSVAAIVLLCGMSLGDPRGNLDLDEGDVTNACRNALYIGPGERKGYSIEGDIGVFDPLTVYEMRQRARSVLMQTARGLSWPSQQQAAFNELKRGSLRSVEARTFFIETLKLSLEFLVEPLRQQAIEVLEDEYR